MDRRVVITAEAAITPLGNSRQRILDNLANGVSGVRSIRHDDLLSGHLHSKVFGTVDYELDLDFERRFRKTMGPVGMYACQVAKEVFAKAGLKQDFVTSGRLGVAFGSTHGSPTVQRGIYKAFYRDPSPKLSGVSAADYLKSMVHTTAVNISRMFGITGRVISSCTACTTSSQSIGYGYETVRYGLQDAMLCGGADEYDTTTVAVFDNLLACSTAFNDTPERTPRPFDKRRDGLVVGEGAGAVLLEEYEFAKRRGADILAEVVGFACTNNGDSLIMPDVNGIVQTLERGLHSASLAPDAVDFASAHATATRLGDATEAEAVHRVFGKGPWVTGLKSYMGHTMGSCGVIETILTLYMMQAAQIAPTLNLDEVDERCAMVRHTGQMRDAPIRVASIQNFAFGGVNTCLLIKRCD